jgi:D-aminopeptidase
VYQFPPLYTLVFGGNPQPSQMDSKVKRMNIHAQRVGEYTLNTCG